MTVVVIYKRACNKKFSLRPGNTAIKMDIDLYVCDDCEKDRTN